MTSAISQEKLDLITRAFIGLRQKGFKLGVGELFAAQEALEGGFGESDDALEETLKILWCSSLSEQTQFDPIWKSLLNRPTTKSQEKITTKESTPQPNPPQIEIQQETSSLSTQETFPEEITSEPEVASLPIQAAPFTPVENEDDAVLHEYYPISRRSMVYNWRYLRRLVPDGTFDVLDVAATIELATHQGFYLSPIYRRRERNHASLLLLLDQNGSMTPFHRFSRDLVETAVYESSLQPEKVKVFYFHNVPGNSVYQDLYLTEPIAVQKVLASCDRNTSIIIVSDAGAARGYRELRRIRSTTSFLFKLKRYSSLTAWLNPMPEERWLGSSAEIIANLIPMYEMNNNGLSNAIDIVRGQPLPHLDSLIS
ncbi:MAG: VWA containing CoxE family protein [Cyanobacteria bacterium P01_F01_bin.143]